MVDPNPLAERFLAKMLDLVDSGVIKCDDACRVNLSKAIPSTANERTCRSFVTAVEKNAQKEAGAVRRVFNEALVETTEVKPTKTGYDLKEAEERQAANAAGLEQFMREHALKPPPTSFPTLRINDFASTVEVFVFTAAGYRN